ncbi:hypothetical protein [Saccharothrix lopnurensis]|uniref:IrrE N-terminal-like domain-containing protein n=1 Tax=Saccharothrix lopnurensis TaxID=1670621 RepID=A0ABW1P6N6_9PSEU
MREDQRQPPVERHRSHSAARPTAGTGGRPPEQELLRLQRTAGNRAVRRLVAHDPVPVQRRFASADMPLGVELSAEVQQRLPAALAALGVPLPADLRGRLATAIADEQLHPLPAWLAANGIEPSAEDVIKKATELAAEHGSGTTAPPSAWEVHGASAENGKLVERDAPARTVFWAKRDRAVELWGRKWLFGDRNPLATRPRVRFVVLLPMGFPPSARERLAAALDVPLAEVLFTNAGSLSPAPGKPSAEFVDEGGQRRFPSAAEKLRPALDTVRDYLAGLGLTRIDEQAVEKWLATAGVTARDKTAFAGPGVIDAANVEGQTTPEARGSRNVVLNTDNHTWGTLVHELFHVLEHPDVMNFSFDNPIGADLQEGITEFFTSEATGFDVRTDHAKKSTMYLRATEFVRDEVGAGRIARAELVEIYFNGIGGAVLDRAREFGKRWEDQRDGRS